MDPWEIQHQLKYRDHDITQEELSEIDVELIRHRAIKDFVETQEGDRVRLLISSFMGYLTGKGYRIIKKDKIRD